MNQSRLNVVLIVASICHEANRRLCETQGDDSQPAWKEAPQWQQESAIKGVEGIADGRITEPKGSHESWSREKIESGWVWGPVKNPETKEHPCLVPFEQLPEEQQLKDHLFFAIASTLLYQLGHKAPAAASAPEIVEDIYRFFAFEHLPTRLRSVSAPFGRLALDLHHLPRSAERTVALRKLLESKDAAVRAAL